jgi:hypothetical protein
MKVCVMIEAFQVFSSTVFQLWETAILRFLGCPIEVGWDQTLSNPEYLLSGPLLASIIHSFILWFSKPLPEYRVPPYVSI